MFQQSGQELGDNLKACMTSRSFHLLYNTSLFFSLTLVALKKYHSINNTFPDRIVVYRDGVGDGQVSNLLVVVPGFPIKHAEGAKQRDS